jgi:hypothetical protein
VIAIITLVLSFIVSGTKPRGPAAPPNEPLPYQLAVNNRGGYIPKDDPSVDEFATLLKQLEGKCVEGEQQIADALVKGQSLMKERNLPIGLLDFKGHKRIHSRDLRQECANCRSGCGLYHAPV